MKSIHLIMFMISVAFLRAQSVVISETESTPDPSAILDVQSTEKGVLVPRVTLESISSSDPVTDPAEGLLVYNSSGDLPKGFYYWDSSEWVYVLNSKSNLVPPGTITAFAGPAENVPEGWLICDGQVYAQTTYPALFEAIGIAWGGSGAVFNVPDLRGYFLRGVDDPAGSDEGANDPDAADRKDLEGNTVGGVVGSYQEDAFQGHWHNILAGLTGGNYVSRSNGGTSSGGTFNAGRDPISDGINGDPKTSSETRPKNAYVNYIIKY